VSTPRQPSSSAQNDEPCVLVEVELRGPSPESMFSHLGSLTERDGMWMYPRGPLPTATEELLVAVAVPRARTPREAEQVVASLLARIKGARMASQSGSAPS
jgi:hypothetical protein